MSPLDQISEPMCVCVAARCPRCGQQLEAKMKDRLEELQSQDQEANPMEKFFQEVATLSLALNELERLSELIDRKQQGVLCCTAEESIVEAKHELSLLKASFASMARCVQPQLSTIQRELAPEHRDWRVEHRIQQSHYQATISRHYANETQYVRILKEKTVRQAELAGLKLHQGDIEQLVAGQSLPRIVGWDLDALRAKQHLAMAHVRHQQLLDLEGQLGELQALFLQLDVLISEQQELLDNIKYNILHTQDYVAQSDVMVKRAIKYKRQSRLSVVLLVVLGLCTCCTCLAALRGQAGNFSGPDYLCP
ncbi:syntaxin-1A-like [Dromiciops gliroides]|uniref:syntaxin-1A-like n=1 Tax=Dromiciops gliroides TaxID=33562 RepID=UPI001CC809E2|nr:syntaxin-1A-like [Dromiciops gliroides]